MAKKNCEKRCLGRIISKERGIYCEHIERKLPKPTKQSIKAYFTNTIEIYSRRGEETRKTVALGDLLHTLLRYGLKLYEVKLVYYRAVRGLSFSTLAKKQGWLNEQSAAYHYRKAIKKLRDGGFKL